MLTYCKAKYPTALYLFIKDNYEQTCDSVDHCAKDGGRLDQFFEDVGLGGQRETVVKHLLQQLVHNNYIVFNGSFTTNSKIVLKESG